MNFKRIINDIDILFQQWSVFNKQRTGFGGCLSMHVAFGSLFVGFLDGTIQKMSKNVKEVKKMSKRKVCFILRSVAEWSKA